MTEAERQRMLAYLNGGEDTELSLQRRRPLGRNLPATDYDPQVALRGLFGRRVHRYHPPSQEVNLPPTPIPQWARDANALRPPPAPITQPYAIGPGGIIDAPETPLQYHSMRAATAPRLGDIFAREPEPVAAPSAMTGYAPGTQANGMRVPPAPASFAPPPQRGLTPFGKTDGLPEDEAWTRALSDAMYLAADPSVLGFRVRRTPAAGGVGLLGMRERVAYYRGHIEFRSRPQAGMRIMLTIPIDDPTTAERGEGGRMTRVG